MTTNNDDLQKHKQQFLDDVLKRKLLPPSSIFQTLTTMEEADDRYRWYLCTEEKPANWVCEQKNIYACLNAYTSNPNNTKSTAASFVYKFIPPVFDNMLVKRDIHNRISVTVKRS